MHHPCIPTACVVQSNYKSERSTLAKMAMRVIQTEKELLVFHQNTTLNYARTLAQYFQK